MEKETRVVNEQIQDNAIQDNLKEWVRPEMVELNVNLTAGNNTDSGEDAQDFGIGS